jgi:hypothetical protein
LYYLCIETRIRDMLQERGSNPLRASQLPNRGKRKIRPASLFQPVHNRETLTFLSVCISTALLFSA